MERQNTKMLHLPVTESLLSEIEEFRAAQRPIPKRAVATRELILKGLAAFQVEAEPEAA